MIVVYTGLPGSGKTVMLARKCQALLERNNRLCETTGVVRKVRTNVSLTPLIVEKFGHLVEPFTDIYTMSQWRDCDVVIDELAVYFDSHEWERLPRAIKGFLRLHRHYRVDIWAVAQDFLTIDKSFRRLTAHLYHVDKIFSRGEPSPFLPPKKYPFAFSVVREVDPKNWELEKEFYSYIPYTTDYELFTAADFGIFDTHSELPEQPLPPLKKEVRLCPDDGYKRVRYI